MASRLAKRCTLGLGLAVVRSSKLGERLSAIYERGGDGRYAASRTARMLVVVGVLALTALVAHGALAQVTARKSTQKQPADVHEALQIFQRESAAASGQATAELREHHAETVARLRAIQDELTRAGKLDEALAVREQIRLFQSMNWPAVGAASEVRATVVRAPTSYRTWTAVTGVTTPAYGRAPDNLSAFASRFGEQIDFATTGSADGSLWGTDLYTHDSSLSKAAVHAGVLRIGEVGPVRVTILKGPAEFHGSVRNGVQSGGWSNPNGTYSAFRVERGPSPAVGVMPPASGTPPNAENSVNVPGIGTAGPITEYPVFTATTVTGGTLRLNNLNSTYYGRPVLDDPGTLSNFTGNRGNLMLIRVVGAVDGPIWGTGLYTHDSDLSSAAVHAGKLRPGEIGMVSLIVENGPPKFHGSTQNGVTSNDWENSSGHYVGYRILEASSQPSTGAVPSMPATGAFVLGYTDPNLPPIRQPDHAYIGRTVKSAPLPDPGMLGEYRGRNGQSFWFRVVGRADAGSVWGTDIYTDDSALAVAAVHAGVLAVGQEATVQVTILPGLNSYRGSTQNGLTSYDYGPFGGSYSIASPSVSGMPAPGGTGLVEGGAGLTTAVANPVGRVVTLNGGILQLSTAIPASAAMEAEARAKAALDMLLSKGQEHQEMLAKYGPNHPRTKEIELQMRAIRDYAVASTASNSATLDDPGVLFDYRSQIGRTLRFRVRGNSGGSIWGTGVYTDDSTLATAAVHAGVLKEGELGMVEVTILPGQSGYVGSTAHGVTSEDFGAFDGSYRVTAPAVSYVPQPTPPPVGDNSTEQLRHATLAKKVAELEAAFQTTSERYRVGLASLQDLLHARSARNNAMFEVARGDAERLALLRQMGADARELEQLITQRMQNGLASPQDVALAQAAVLQSQNLLAELQGFRTHDVPRRKSEGTVVDVLPDGTVVLTLDSTQGVDFGRGLTVWRDRGERAEYLGRLEILRIENDTVMGRVISETRQGTIERGDHVTTNLP